VNRHTDNPTLFTSALCRLNYYRRIFAAYLTPQKSHLTFWHEVPEVNKNFRPGELGEYYMPFTAKADYPGQYDQNGIPLLNYHGKVGLQYNPIAIAQYGLGNYNLFRRTGDPERRHKFLAAADWLVSNLEQNPAGLWVWNHHFDWEYRTPLKAPWYSALAQGQGISLLVRAHRETEDLVYLEAAQRAFVTFLRTTVEGGVTYVDDRGYTWFEEVIVDPPTHILNGFIWAAWGVYDYHLHTGDQDAAHLFAEAVRTLKDNLHRFDAGLKMLASPFYHHLHIVQLQVMHRLTGDPVFADYAHRWEVYRRDPLKRTLALTYKALFKMLYY
jgi:heparosan-N-sulfate-glucuronate 5-epimerase